MGWKTIRLELGITDGFPNGSAARAYLLRLPLDSDGRIEEGSLSLTPARATVRRHWPNQADRNGRLVRVGEGWGFSYGSGDAPCPLGIEAFMPGAQILVDEGEGRSLPYRVTSCEG